LPFAVDCGVATSQEEVVLFFVDLFELDCHHQAQQQFVFFEEASAGVSVSSCFVLVSNSVQLLLQRVVEAWFLDVVFDGLLEQHDVRVQGELVHWFDQSKVVDNEEKFRSGLG
jgi:hypothetical protein